MGNLVPSPLCQDSDIQVYRPPLDFFIQKIKNDHCFSFTRQMHGLWDGVIAAWILKPELRQIRLSDEEYIRNLANTISETKRIIEDLHYEPDFYVELFEILKSLDANDSSLMFGVSDTYFFPESPPAYSTQSFALPNKCRFKLLPTKDDLNYFKVRFKDRQNVMKLLMPAQYPFYDAMLWKLYTYCNEIWSFFEAIKDHDVVLVGPPHYKRFGSLAGLNNYHHIQIHGSKASETRELTMTQIIQKHETLKLHSKPPVYIFVAGSVSVYWVYHLHNKLENKFLIDVGQALNFLFDSKTALVGKEFGYSQSGEKGRRVYKTKKLYGDRDFHSFMTINDSQVHFDLKLRLKDIWVEKLIDITSKQIVNLYTIKRLYYRAKHNFFNLFRSA